MRLKTLVCSVCLMLWCGKAAAADVVSELVVEGNDRTADSVILNAAGLKPGDELDSSTLKRVKRRVQNLAIFGEVKVSQERDQDGVRVLIRVEERWTLFPVPFFSASGSGYGGGLFLLERNFLGYNKTLALGGLYTTQGIELLSYYKDPSIAGSDFTLEALGSYVDEVRHRYAGPDEIYSYRDTRWTIDVSPGYQLTRKLRVNLGYFGDLSSTSREGDFSPPPAGGDLHGLVTSLQVEAYDFQFYYNQGLNLELKFRAAQEAVGSDRDFTQSNLEATYSTAAFADHAASIKLQYMTVRGDDLIDQFVVGGIEGTRGFESEGLWVTSLGAVTLDYQIPFFKPSWGTWTTALYTDLGYADRGPDSKPQGYASPGVGVRLYLKQLALPALGVDATWSVEDERPLFTAVVGLAL